MTEHLETDESTSLIASNKVEGTAVYNHMGERLGTIYNFMVDKFSGDVRYAVLSFGGFLGIGQDYYPLPWSMLNYDTSRGGYVVDLEKSQLENAPRFAAEDEPTYDRDYGKQVYNYYGVDYPW